MQQARQAMLQEASSRHTPPREPTGASAAAPSSALRSGACAPPIIGGRCGYPVPRKAAASTSQSKPVEQDVLAHIVASRYARQRRCKTSCARLPEEEFLVHAAATDAVAEVTAAIFKQTGQPLPIARRLSDHRKTRVGPPTVQVFCCAALHTSWSSTATSKLLHVQVDVPMAAHVNRLTQHVQEMGS